jgi:hypothetical protein
LPDGNAERAKKSKANALIVVFGVLAENKARFRGKNLDIAGRPPTETASI